jgi:hypothetical protein
LRRGWLEVWGRSKAMTSKEKAAGGDRRRIQESENEVRTYEIISQAQHHQNSGVDLILLLDTLDATQDLWESLPVPYSLFLLETRRAIAESVGMCRDDD